MGDLPVLLEDLVYKAESRHPRRHFDAGASPAGHGGHQLDEADLSRGRDVGAAAGADVIPRHLHDPHRPGKGPFGPVGKGFQLLRRGGVNF